MAAGGLLPPSPLPPPPLALTVGHHAKSREEMAAQTVATGAEITMDSSTCVETAGALLDEAMAWSLLGAWSV